MTMVREWLQTLLLNEGISTLSKLRHVLVKAEEYLTTLPSDTPVHDFAFRYVLIPSHRLQLFHQIHTDIQPLKFIKRLC